MSNYENGPGNVPRLPDRVVDTLIDSAGVSRCAPGRGINVVDQTANVERLVHDTCEELLARLPAPVSAPTAGKRQSIEDDEDFWALVTAWANSRGTVRDHLAKAALIAHIDTWASRSAGDAVPAQTELLAAADAVVERWHSRDWKQPHTAEFVNRLAAAVGAVKFGGAAPARGNTEKPTESQKGENA